MTELEILKHAKMYMEKLANGYDPITGLEAPENDIINNVRLSRCFFYVSSVLGKVIDNGGVIGARPRGTKPFALTMEQARHYPYSDTPIPVSAIAERIDSLRPDAEMKKFRYTSITSFLMQSGILEEISMADGKKVKRPTDAGQAFGIFTEARNGQAGPYTVVLYSRNAQQFILDNLDGIIEINNMPKN